jgi:hypothetical protein
MKAHFLMMFSHSLTLRCRPNEFPTVPSSPQYDLSSHTSHNAFLDSDRHFSEYRTSGLSLIFCNGFLKGFADGRCKFLYV